MLGVELGISSSLCEMRKHLGLLVHNWSSVHWVGSVSLSTHLWMILLIWHVVAGRADDWSLLLDLFGLGRGNHGGLSIGVALLLRSIGLWLPLLHILAPRVLTLLLVLSQVRNRVLRYVTLSIEMISEERN